jgi:hypothetical protein
MYDNPVLFPAISNRETWLQTILIADDQTGDPISLTDTNNNPLYQVYVQISPPRRNDYYSTYTSGPYYGGFDPMILASLADYITLPDVGVIKIQIPYTIIQTLHGNRTYDVFLRIEDTVNNDARQLLIGKLPVSYGGEGP